MWAETFLEQMTLFLFFAYTAKAFVLSLPGLAFSPEDTVMFAILLGALAQRRCRSGHGFRAPHQGLLRYYSIHRLVQTASGASLYERYKQRLRSRELR